MDFFDKLGKKASETYKVTAEKTTKIAKETKLKLEISNYKSNMEDLYKIVGKKIYQKYAAQEEMQLEDIQDELNKLDTIIEKYNQNLCLKICIKKNSVVYLQYRKEQSILLTFNFYYYESK